MPQSEEQSQGSQLLTAVERILADTDSLVALAQEHLRRAQARAGEDGPATRDAAAESVVQHFSLRTAITGGLTAAPAMFPGAGTLLAVAGGALADMGLMLKYEVEMALVLSHVYGFDITRQDERQLAFLLASVSAYDAKSGGNFFMDVAQAEGVAVWRYTPRQVSKLLVSVMAKLALFKVSKGLLRALPLVGIAVGSSLNKVLTQRVGERCIRELKTRRQLVKKPAPAKKAAKPSTAKKARKKAV
ncbi:EcsC protein family protein [Stigmatella aurantiaca]|uniref:EcsC protein family protein n=1 Tax=Stigmatella aurantiaca TaxID=41 RepID=A0A1H7YJF5_STIAU|nr:EcsC family protein [Stigmatella aurantiaca]SEM46376.1 EcsC protein family protein [Stigmatella aurantiaca]